MAIQPYLRNKGSQYPISNHPTPTCYAKGYEGQGLPPSPEGYGETRWMPGAEYPMGRVSGSSSLEDAKAMILSLMAADKRVLTEPAKPAVFVTDVGMSGVQLFAICWTENSDWMTTRSDLWSALIREINTSDTVDIAKSQHEVETFQKPT